MFAQGPAIWRVAVWLVLLLAVIGVFLYGREALTIVQAVRAGGMPPEAVVKAQSQLYWDIAYLAACLVLAWLAAMTLQGRAWARQALRFACALVAVWAAVTAWGMWTALRDIKQALSGVLADATVPLTTRDAVQSMFDYIYLSIGLRVAAIPVMGWVCWRLGQRSDGFAA
jgi:hypothetical protein